MTVPKPSPGLTLIELMITLAVLAIVVAIGIPSFNTMIQNNRSLALGEELAGALNYARSEAIKRGQRVTLCGTTDGAACNGTWANNWIVVVDTAATDAAAAPVVADAAAVLRFWEAPDSNATVTVTQGGSNTTFVRFTRQGTLGRSSQGAVTMNASFSGCTSNAARAITVGVAGMLKMARSSTGCS
ncbi:GspH/FimT family pseudopilin [Microbulbifer hydrolyticus]|uniref:Type II secretion system protein H n=1 Tax=Microbulbifer hydrolyticus TaxID=48074 RepID=A0A6P1THM9_9GAMM|nr:GspH/FimT family pseudopilin [Microbulbifer hydrolyticus]MBB5210923.1 type IV fimbrial biogenesis protein FimT [Microbulbifer hydrolyticus]QHQ40709.1 prepilin-type N-terminal cleavage/methylation domain-containing protein [Microbulbifer hydrolyticus]